MSLSAIQSYLVATVPAFAGRVYVAREMDSAVEYAATSSGGSPSAVVFDPVETASANSMRVGRSVVQDVVLQFTVLICVRYAGDSARAIADLDAIRDCVRSAMLGWTGVSVDNNPVEFVKGSLAFNSRVEEYANVGVAIWADQYRTDFTVRSIQ